MEKIIVVSGPVIVENNKVLLAISGNDDFWKFCGGKAGEAEDLLETAKKRIKEELNLDIKIINQEPFLLHVKKPGNEDVDVLLAHYLSERIGEPTAGAENKDWRWFDVNDLPENIAPNIIPTLKHFKFLV